MSVPNVKCSILPSHLQLFSSSNYSVPGVQERSLMLQVLWQVSMAVCESLRMLNPGKVVFSSIIWRLKVKKVLDCWSTSVGEDFHIHVNCV